MRVSRFTWMLLVAAALAVVGCQSPVRHNLPPSQRLLEPGPGVGGPGPGVLQPPAMPMMGPPGYPGGPMMGPMPQAPTVQLWFAEPQGSQVSWDISGQGIFDSQPLIVPARQTFGQGGIYRLKVTNIEGREGLELYPTIEVGPATPRSNVYLAHSAIPIVFNDEDFAQAQTGNYVTKVIYLPDPEFQELALADVQTLVSTRLDPGLDPIVEADRRGAILAIIRLGNKDLETPADGMGVIQASHNARQPAQALQPPPQLAPGGASALVAPPMGGAQPYYGGAPGYAAPTPIGRSGMPPPHVVGVTSPLYGMPMSATPIGLPGPPHIPLGGPAGLRKHVMRNWSKHNMPRPTSKLKINVNQRPGYSYPKPPSRVFIRQESIHPVQGYRQPAGNKFQIVP